MTAEVFSLAACLVAVLAATVAFVPRDATRRTRLATGAVAVTLALIPVGGWTLPRWLAGLGAVPSASSVALLAAFVWARVIGWDVLDARAWRTAWCFFGAAAVVLYPMALGLGRLDPYALGWGATWMLGVLWAISVGLVWRQNRFALVLAVAVLAFDLRLLESTNLWDYLIDPPLAAVSLSVMATAGVHRLRRWRTRTASDPGGEDPGIAARGSADGSWIAKAEGRNP